VISRSPDSHQDCGKPLTNSKSKTMLDTNVLDFLKALQKNNNREWFEANKEFYHKSKKSFDNFVLRLIQIVKSIDPQIGSPEPKDCTFRIYRDVRFSKEKSPYKTNFGAYVNRGGKNSAWAGYYFHIEPGEIFMSGGIYMPESPILKAIREAISDEPENFKAIIDDPGFKKYFPELYGEQLKTFPQGYPKDHPYIELLKYKSYIVYRPIEEKMLTSPFMEDEIRNTYTRLKTFNDFLNRAIEHLV
jgi:uncharacterized protein (TIGR02453 family)